MDSQPKILVAYYSLTGHTKQVAEELATLLNADVDRILDRKARGGILNFLPAGRDALKAVETEITVDRDPGEYDLVVAGTPIWAGTMAPAVRTYLKRYGSQLRGLAAFTLAGSGGPETAVAAMEEVAGQPVRAYVGIRDRELKDQGALRARLADLVARLQ
jgi:flavodoxin